MLSGHAAFGRLDESKMDAFVVQAGVFLEHCHAASPNQKYCEPSWQSQRVS
jgi:hypothetical protein